MAAENQDKSQETAARPARSMQIGPFTVECADERNRQILVTTLRQVLRGRWTNAAFYGAEGGGRALGEVMGRMPDVPGVRLVVRPRELKVRIFDPLKGDEKLAQQINDVLSNGNAVAIINSGAKFVGGEESIQTLDEDEMKTLLMEIARKVYGKPYEMVAVTGKVPTHEELQSAPGEELFDMMSNSATKPRYVKDVPAWKRGLDRVENA